MYQRVSFSCVLSTLSPVAITSSGRRLSTGLRILRTCCTVSSITKATSPSCGRYAASSEPP